MSGVHLWQISFSLWKSEATFRMLRFELTEVEKEQAIDIVDTISGFG